MWHQIFLGPSEMISNALVVGLSLWFKVQGKLKQSKKQLFEATIQLIFKEKKSNLEPTLVNQLLKLILECGFQFFCWGLQTGPKIRWMMDNNLCFTLSIISHFSLIFPKYAYLF